MERRLVNIGIKEYCIGRNYLMFRYRLIHSDNTNFPMSLQVRFIQDKKIDYPIFY